jgi:hypothetical protein
VKQSKSDRVRQVILNAMAIVETEPVRERIQQVQQAQEAIRQAQERQRRRQEALEVAAVAADFDPVRETRGLYPADSRDYSGLWEGAAFNRESAGASHSGLFGLSRTA